MNGFIMMPLIGIMSLENFETFVKKKKKKKIEKENSHAQQASFNGNSAFCCLPVLHFFLIIYNNFNSCQLLQ